MRWFLIALLATGCGRLGFEPTGGDGDGDSPVSLVVYDDGSPVEGQDVLFHDASGALVTATRTDAAGVATATVSAGGSVTLVTIEGGGAYTLHTHYGVQPGDSLQFGNPDDPYAAVGDVAVQMPGVFPGAADYSVSDGCNSNDSADPNGVESGTATRLCSKGDRVSLVATAFDAAGDPIAYSAVRDVPLSALGAPIAMPTWDPTTRSVTFSVTNLPQVAGYLDLKTESGSGGNTFAYDEDGTDVPTGEPVLLGVSRPAALDELAHFPCIYFDTGGATGYYIRETLPDADVTIPVDFAAALPELAAVTVDSSGGRAEVGMLAAGSMVSADVGLVRLRWTGGGNQVEWNLAFPPDQTELTTPELPDLFAQLRLDGSESFDLPSATYLDLDYVSSADEARQQWWGRWFEPLYFPEEFQVTFSEIGGFFE